MADSQSNARLRADAGAPTSGVIHVRTRLTADFTVISNALAQRPGSAVTVGVGVYILSLPTGTPVSIDALCEHFSEGEILISRALRELEAAGYLERRRERLPSGQIRTRTYFYDVPGGGPDPDPDGPPAPGGPPDPPKPPRPRRSSTAERPTPSSAAVIEEAPVSAPDRPEEPASLSDADPQAIAVLTSLRRVDPRLVLSEREAVRLAPAVGQWLAAGVAPSQITAHLTARLPDHFLTRPAGILAFRLRETPLPAPPPAPLPPTPDRPAVLPFQTCDGCERAFRAPVPARCRDCRRREEKLPAAA
ncbi:helix-turn-helix domain-containing protein [Streptomyces chlorus]|uniref:DNA-binding protein n=1 Tax=Streptomyces chlorus TaxID=887452 RepID=A0ABW1DY23_9ACTN